MVFTVDQVIHVLQHYKSFSVVAFDLTDPHQKTLSYIQGFTDRLVLALQSKQSEIAGIPLEIIAKLYSRLPPFTNMELFRVWVKRMTLIHPLRRSLQEHMWICIADLQASLDPVYSIPSIIHQAIAARSEGYARNCAPENLYSDPDTLYFHRKHNGLLTIELQPSTDLNASFCIVCTNPYDQASHTPQKAPCSHIHCKSCLETWLEQCQTQFTCPQCRACLICGTDNCAHHPITRDIADPVPLMHIITDYDNETGAASQLSHSVITPRWFFALRERTRDDRARLRYLDAMVDEVVDQDDADRELLMASYTEVVQKLRGAVDVVRRNQAEGGELVGIEHWAC